MELHKTLYGLKSVARELHRALVRVLFQSELGFVCSASDPGLYVRTVGRFFLFLGVDDLFMFGED